MSGNLELSVSVLTMGFWPSYPLMEIIIPQEVTCTCSVHVCVLNSVHNDRCTVHNETFKTLFHCKFSLKRGYLQTNWCIN